MRLLVLILSILLTALAAIASADENRIATDPNSFEGAYVGGILGLAVGNGVTDSPLLSGGTVVESFDPGIGRIQGFYAGYNFQNGNFVYGAEAVYAGLVGVIVDTNLEDREVMQVLDVRGRLGYVLGDLMFYGTLGWSSVQMHVHPGTLFKKLDNRPNRPHDAALDGVNYGFGVEYNINNHWSAGVDFTHRSLSGEFPEATKKSKLDLDTLSIRLAYRF